MKLAMFLASVKYKAEFRHVQGVMVVNKCGKGRITGCMLSRLRFLQGLMRVEIHLFAVFLGFK